MKVRRVVTGHMAEGKSTVMNDSEVDPITTTLLPGFEFCRLWGGDATPTVPQNEAMEQPVNYFPPVGGFRLALFTVPPQSTTPHAPRDMKEALAEVDAKLPGLLSHLEPDTGGMHTTDTVDVDYILTGEVSMELDDGVEVHLTPGDTVVQNGTRHAWRNKSSEPCRMLCVLVGARRVAK